MGGCPDNVLWMLYQYCILTINSYIYTTLSQHFPTFSTLRQYSGCCGNIALQHWGMMLRQCSGNVVWMFGNFTLNIGDQHWDHIKPTSYAHCCNIALNVRDKYWDNIHANLCEHCLNVSAQVSGQECQFEFSTHLQHQHAFLHWHNCM